MMEEKKIYIEKMCNPFTELDELIKLFMMPIPQSAGIIECTITRNKSGFNRFYPKYTLMLSEGEKFLLNGKKRGANKTANYMITLDQDNLKRKGKGFLGKLRANFLGTEFNIFDNGENPKKTTPKEAVRNELGSVVYESNVLGSKGPRKMKVLIPMLNKDGNPVEWKPVEKGESMSEQYKDNKKSNMLVFNNKFPKWNDTVQAYVLNFNGRVDQASVKNF